VHLPALLTLEDVEDAVGGDADLERVPRDGALLGDRELAALLQEGGELVALAGLGLEQGQQSSVDAHRRVLSSVRSTGGAAVPVTLGRQAREQAVTSSGMPSCSRTSR